MSNQARITSLIEVCMSTGIGFVISFTAWPFIAHLYDIPYTTSSNFGITAIYTVLSISRSYCMRRFFENDLHRVAVRIAGGWVDGSR